jgi:hypothetical protein
MRNEGDDDVAPFYMKSVWGDCRPSDLAEYTEVDVQMQMNVFLRVY